LNAPLSGCAFASLVDPVRSPRQCIGRDWDMRAALVVIGPFIGVNERRRDKLQADGKRDCCSAQVAIGFRDPRRGRPCRRRRGSWRRLITVRALARVGRERAGPNDRFGSGLNILCDADLRRVAGVDRGDGVAEAAEHVEPIVVLVEQRPVGPPVDSVDLIGQARLKGIVL